MARGFTEHERDAIRASLIEACKQCWTRYGYHKTGIRELTLMAGISAGAFYQFFSSKELLFVAAADDFQGGLMALFEENMQRYPGKRGLAESLKAVAAQMSQASWLTAMWDEWPAIERKLPPDYVEQDFRKDTLRVAEIVAQYGLVPRRDVESVTQIIDILLASVSRTKFMPGETDESFNFIIDAVVDALFE